jgi:hypothetical protein
MYDQKKEHRGYTEYIMLGIGLGFGLGQRHIRWVWVEG